MADFGLLAIAWTLFQWNWKRARYRPAPVGARRWSDRSNASQSWHL